MIWAAVGQALEILKIFLGWWVSLDDKKRKQIVEDFKKVEAAKDEGKQTAMRSAINRLNASL